MWVRVLYIRSVITVQTLKISDRHTLFSLICTQIKVIVQIVYPDAKIVNGAERLQVIVLRLAVA